MQSNLPLFSVFPLGCDEAEMPSPPKSIRWFEVYLVIAFDSRVVTGWFVTDSFPPSCHMALTFLLAPPSDTLGLVLKSPSKLNIVSFD